MFAITPMIAFISTRFTLGITPYVSLLPALVLARQMRAARRRGLCLGSDLGSDLGPEAKSSSDEKKLSLVEELVPAGHGRS